MFIGTRLKELRSNRNMTQKELSSELDLSLDMIKSLEQNRATPSVETLLKICDLFGCTTDYLLEREQDQHIADQVIKEVEEKYNVNVKDDPEIVEMFRKLVESYIKSKKQEPPA